jgi:hypothetical protein
MLIITKKSEKDYYDGVVGTMGIDKTLVYNRQIIEIDKKYIPTFLNNGKRSRLLSSSHNLGGHSIKKECEYQSYGYFIIGFCGRLYVGWKLYKEIKSKFDTELLTNITYDFNYMNSILNSSSWHGNFVDNYNRMVNYDAIQLFRDYKTPVFIYDSDHGRISIGRGSRNGCEKFIINPILSHYQFYKVFDSFQAFQEISMFIGGVLGQGEKEIIEVEDKYKIEQHGFNKWSFRKEPSGK